MPFPPRRPISVLAAAGLVIGLLGGCSAGTAPAATSTGSLAVDGVQRTYRLYVPADVAEPAPLVVMLHGGFGSAAQAQADYHWDARADAGRFAVLYPDGLDHAWAVGGGGCGRPGDRGVDDVRFISSLIDSVDAQLPLDRSRLYATGMSNGGLMSYRLACDTDLFAAVAPVAATVLGACAAPEPVSLVALHGDADRNVPYLGGPGEGVARIDGPAVPQVHRRWLAIDDCPAPVVTTAGAVTTSRAECPGGRTVELVTVAGAGHQWPGARPNRVAKLLGDPDPPSTALDATDVIWRFFAAHPRPA